MLYAYRQHVYAAQKIQSIHNATISTCVAIDSSFLEPKRSSSFHVIRAEFLLTTHRGREFFKLSRIELRCEVTPGTTIVIDPIEDPATDLLALEDSESESPVRPEVSTLTQGNAMEIDTRPPPPHAGSRHAQGGQHHGSQQYPQPSQYGQEGRQSLPATTTQSPSVSTSHHQAQPKAPSNPPPSMSPAMRSVNDVPYSTQPPSREPSAGVNRREFVPVASQMRSPSEVHQVNGHTYPRPPAEVSLDAIERLQTQISQNSGALAAHTRDIRRGEESFQQLETNLRREFAAQVQRQSVDIARVDETVTRLHSDMQGIRQALEALRHDFILTRSEVQRGGAMAPGQPVGVSDTALEMMAQQVAVMSHKTAELDNLRITVEIMKKKIHRLETGAAAAPAAQPMQHMSQPPHPTVSSNAPPPAISRENSTFQTPSNPGQSAEAMHRPESTPSQSTGWASVNAGGNTGVKRMHPNDVESPLEGAVHVPGSPKRQKMAGADTQASIAHSQHTVEGRDVTAAEPSFRAPPVLPSQRSIPESTLRSQTQQSMYAPYGTQDGPSDDSWRPESQRHMEHRPRGRRGGGPGSRGGRVRKSMPAQVHQLGTPEWERDDWHGVTDSQTDPNGFYNHIAHAGRGIARRGTGGGGRGGYAHSDRAASLGSQGVSPGFGMGMGSLNDPYAHTKKTRSKPIRNADGVLIRKDGRPDMRSQSSAANLRKVHARKEGESSTQGSPTGFTPVNMHRVTDTSDTPSPSGYAHPDENAPPEVQQKHSAIMGKMFPDGVDQSRKQHDYARQVFEEDNDHTAHPRGHKHALQRAEAHKAAIEVKKERFEQSRIADSQSQDDGDVEMDEHSPVERENSEQFHDAEPEAQEQAEQVVPETQAVEQDSTTTMTMSEGTMQASTA